jgi:hypothetical protein
LARFEAVRAVNARVDLRQRRLVGQITANGASQFLLFVGLGEPHHVLLAGPPAHAVKQDCQPT